MFETPFYNQTIRKTIIGFGTLFSNMKIQRQSKDGNNTVLQTVNVPIAYAQKEKEIQRTDGDPNLRNNVRTTLPRMTFEITGYSYDASRKMNTLSKLVCNSSVDNTRKEVFTPVPWNVDIQLDLLTKNQEDALQVLEQILPLFRPEYTLVLNTIPEMNIVSEVPITLNSVTASDNYVGSMTDARLVVHTFTFTAKLVLYGGIGQIGIIKKVIANVTENPSATYTAEGTAPGEPIIEQWVEDI